MTEWWNKFADEKYSEVLDETNRILAQPHHPNRLEAQRLQGLSYFRMEEYAPAEKAFEQVAHHSTNPDDWFNLVTSATLNCNLSLAENAFHRTVELHQQHGTKDNISLPHIFNYYMHALCDVQEYTRAFAMLEKLKSIYVSLVITDTTFLYLRSVPSFSNTMNAAKSILPHIEKQKAKQFLSDLKKHVDDEGKEYVEAIENSIFEK